MKRCLLFALGLAVARPAVALDKQGSAHGGELDTSTGFGLSGSLMVGVSVYNETYAARPDNSGLALMRYAGHADIDILGPHLSIPVDVNMFTDRTQEGLEKLRPSELDLIGGLTSTWALGPGAFELGARYETDRSVDVSGPVQKYADARARYLFSLAAVRPGIRSALREGDLRGWGTLGWFFYNPSYYARPDNTGKALLRYGLHLELSGLGDRFAVALDTTMFTDREAANPVRPSELDLTPELICRLHDFEMHVAYERDMPVDRGGLVQHFVYLLGAWSFTAL